MKSVLKKIVLILLIALTVLSGETFAAKKKKAGKAFTPVYAALVLDHQTGKILHQTNIDQITHPASLTKVMTLYLLFDALKKKKITMQTRLPISKHAANQKPGKLSLNPGSTIAVRDAIPALVVKSANDVAAAVAEYLAGSEPQFGIVMTQKARQLGMKNTVFKNASGLPNKQQITTAREMVILFKALYRDFPDYYRYCKHKSFTYNGQKHPAHTKILGHRPEIDGYKTGFVNASGFNIVISAKRQNTRLFAVVMGGQNSRWRDKRLENLLDQYFPIALRLNANRPKSPQEPDYPEIAEIESTDGVPTPVSTIPVAIEPPKKENLTTGPLSGDLNPPSKPPSKPQGPEPETHPPKEKASPEGPSGIDVEADDTDESRIPEPTDDQMAVDIALPSKNDSALLANIIENNSFEQLENLVEKKPEQQPQKPTISPKASAPQIWATQLGTFPKKATAQKHLNRINALVPALPGDATVLKTGKRKKASYTVRLSKLTKSEAESVCQKMRFHQLPCLALKN